MESEENQMLQTRFHMTVFLTIIKSTLEVDDVAQVVFGQQPNHWLHSFYLTLFWPNIRGQEGEAYTTAPNV